MFVGLVSDPRWEPPDGLPEPEPHRSWPVPWRALAWVATFWVLLALIPAADDAGGPLAGYGLLLATVVLAVWRLDRWCSRQYWRGLRDHQS
jgi:hypothetical protein